MKIIKKNEIVIIDVNSLLQHQRNEGLGIAFRPFLVECLGAIYRKNHKITTYSLSYEEISEPTRNKIHLTNFSLPKDVGVQDHEITEKAALCVNFVILPLIVNYSKIRVTKRNDGVDYILSNIDENFVLESKGDTTKYHCRSRIEEGRQQVLDSFKRLKKSDFSFGLVGVSCFYEGNHYFLKLEKKVERGSNMGTSNSKDAVSDQKKADIDKLTEKSSRLITDAMVHEAKGEYDQAKQLFWEASKIEIDVALELEELNSLKAFDHWVSALNCALSAENYVMTMLIVKDLRQKRELTQEDIKILNDIELRANSIIRVKERVEISDQQVRKMIKWVLYKLQEVHKKIRGRFSLMKIMFDFRQRLIPYGYYMPISFSVSKNPIYSSKLNQILEEYQESGFLIQKTDSSLALSSRALKILVPEIPSIEEMIKEKFSEDFLEEIIGRIEFLGDKTSKEITEMEREAGITSYQFGRPIIHEMIANE